MNNGKIISQDRYGNNVKTYTFCKNSTVTLEKRNSYITDCFIDYHPKYKNFDEKKIK